MKRCQEEIERLKEMGLGDEEYKPFVKIEVTRKQKNDRKISIETRVICDATSTDLLVMTTSLVKNCVCELLEETEGTAKEIKGFMTSAMNDAVIDRISHYYHRQVEAINEDLNGKE